MLPIDPRKLVVLAGAGISIPSGIASGQLFNQLLTPLLVPKEFADRGVAKPLLDAANTRRLRFEQLVQTIRDQADPDLLILHYLEQSWTPSALHYWAASCLANGTPVLTTNLDSLIEMAYFLTTERLPAQAAVEDDFAAYQDHRGKPTLFKLHGTLRRIDYVQHVLRRRRVDRFMDLGERHLDSFRVTLDSIGTLQGVAAPHRSAFLLPDVVIQTLRSLLSGQVLLVVGYSGADDFDIAPTLRHLKDVYERIVWIDHKSTGPITSRTVGKFSLIRGPTMQALSDLKLVSTLPSDPTVVDARAQFHAFCEEWLEKAHITRHDMTLITGALLDAVGLLSNAICIWEWGLEDVFQAEVSSAARYYLALGPAYLREGSYVQSEEICTLGSQRCMTTENVNGFLAAQLGFAESGFAFGAVRREEQLQQHALNVVRAVRDTATEYPGVLEYAARADILQAKLLRYRGDLKGSLVAANGALHDGAPYFQRNKILYCSALRELALACLSSGFWDDYCRHAAELERMYDLLNLKREHAVYLSEAAVTASTVRPDHATNLFRKANRLFRSTKTDVGIALTTEALFVLDNQYHGSPHPLIESAATYLKWGLSEDTARTYLLLAAAAILKERKDVAAKYCAAAESQARSRDHSFQTRVRHYAQAIVNTPSSPTLMPEMWRQLRLPIQENIGVSGWHMEDRPCPNYFDEQVI
jgi:hypothetical protein